MIQTHDRIETRNTKLCKIVQIGLAHIVADIEKYMLDVTMKPITSPHPRNLSKCVPHLDFHLVWQTSIIIILEKQKQYNDFTLRTAYFFHGLFPRNGFSPATFNCVLITGNCWKTY